MYTTTQNLVDGITLADTDNGVYISDIMDVSMRSNLSFQFSGADITGGDGTFKVQISNDQENWVDYNRLNENIENDNTENDTRVGSVNIAADGSEIYFTPNGDYFRYCRIHLTIQTDGEYTCTASSSES